MNPRQRRGVMFIVVSVLAAVAVLIIVTNYVRGVSSQVGPTTTVYQAAGPIEAYVPLNADNVIPVQVPERWTSPTSRLELAELENRRVGFRLETGTVLTSDMLIPPSDLSPTEREIAIQVDAVTGVAGRVRPGDRVDIYAALSEVAGLPTQVQVLARDIRVVSISGQLTVVQQDQDGAAAATVIPVTLALEQNQALAVTWAASFASEVRLVALPTDVGLDRQAELDSFDADNLGGTAVNVGEQP